MPLTLKRARNGCYRPYWYGELIIDGKRRVYNLGIRWKGIVPDSLCNQGDALFESSRAKAQEKLDQLRNESKEKGQVQHLTKRLIESKSGQEVAYVKLSDLASLWRRGNLSTELHLESCDAAFRSFEDAVAELQPGGVYVYEITRSTVECYAGALRKELSDNTARRRLRMLKTAFARSLPVGAKNPFDPLPWPRGRGAGEEIHRVPFTGEELESIFACAKESDPELYPLIVCGACTGLRLGDLCRLKWDAINLKTDIIAVKTNKTGERVEIPVYPPLRGIFKEILRRVPGRNEDYVWPWAAAIMDSKPPKQILTKRFKRVVARALSPSSESVTPISEPQELSNVISLVSLSVIKATKEGERRARILDNLTRYAHGASVRTIEKDTGCSRGQISMDFHFAQKVSGIQFMPLQPTKSIVHSVNEITRRKRPGSGRMASIRDWHALRTTWATLALSAGVPIEVARLVTGHRTIEVILANYFKPQREHLRKALAEKMPAVITGGAVDTAEETGTDAEIKRLADRVGAGKATPEERARLGQLLSGGQAIQTQATPRKKRGRSSS